MEKTDDNQNLWPGYPVPNDIHAIGIDHLTLSGSAEYYSLPDAALHAAFDAAFDGQIEGVDHLSFSSFEVDDPVLRRAIAPTHKTILEILVRCVSSGVLKAEVKARSPLDSSPDPERTYITLDELVACLELHGFSRGDYLAELLEDEAAALHFEGERTAQDRAHFRHGAASFPPAPPSDVVAQNKVEGYWEGIARGQAMIIAEMQRRVEGGSPVHRESELGTKERNTLLTIIGVLCKQAGVDSAKAAKTAGILHQTAAEMGVALGETTIESKLKAIPLALAARLK